MRKRLECKAKSWKTHRGGASRLPPTIRMRHTPEHSLTPLPSSMHPAYAETHFHRRRAWKDWPEAFAILTAYATTGQTWPSAENAAADRALVRELLQRAAWVRRLTGYSPVTGHAEPGWAVALGFDMACEIGLRYRQDALYYVYVDTLSVSFCDARRQLIELGPFRRRVHTAADTPTAWRLPVAGPELKACPPPSCPTCA